MKSNLLTILPKTLLSAFASGIYPPFHFRKWNFLAWRMVFAAILYFLAIPGITRAQTTVVCTPTSGSATWSPDPSVIVFGIRNTNNFPIVITGLSNYCYANHSRTYALWYNQNTTTGAPGAISTANGWVQENAGTPVNTTTAGVKPIFAGLNLVIPANTTYRIALAAITGGGGTGLAYGPSSTTSPNLFANGGVQVFAQANPISPTYVGFYPNSAVNTPRSFYGTITFAPAQSPCAAPTSPNVTGITATSAELNWTQSGTPAQWEIKYGAPGFNVNTEGISIITTTKPYTLNPPLTPGTSYDYYVRAICGTNNNSAWSPVTNFTTSCNQQSVVSMKDSFNCGQGSVTLEATASTGAAIKWYAAANGGAALFTGNMFTTPIINATTTYYAAAATGICESFPRQAVTATIRPLPAIALGNDTTICPGVIYTLDAGNPGAGYSWNTGANTQTVIADTSGLYSVQVTVNGCSSSDTLVIIDGVVPQPVLAATSDLCEGATAMLDAGNAGSSYLWLPEGTTNQTLDVTTGGIRSVTITSATGCTIVDSTEIIMRPLPLVDLGNDTAICNGRQILLDAGNPGHTYLWLPGGDTTQTIAVTDTGHYSVTVTSLFNCAYTDEKHIAFLPPASIDGFNFIPLFNIANGQVSFEPVNPQFVQDYLWDFGDGNTSTQMRPIHTYASGGIYEVRLNVSNTCGVMDTSLVINVDFSTGITKTDAAGNQFYVYPNPAISEIIIQSTEGNDQIDHILIYNTLGQVVYNSGKIGSTKFRLEVQQLASGNYLLQIASAKGKVFKKVNLIR